MVGVKSKGTPWRWDAGRNSAIFGYQHCCSINNCDLMFQWSFGGLNNVIT